MEEILSCRETANLLKLNGIQGCSLQTVTKLFRMGAFPDAKKLGKGLTGAIMIPKGSVLEYIERMKSKKKA